MCDIFNRILVHTGLLDHSITNNPRVLSQRVESSWREYEFANFATGKMRTCGTFNWQICEFANSTTGEVRIKSALTIRILPVGTFAVLQFAGSHLPRPTCFLVAYAGLDQGLFSVFLNRQHLMN